MKSNLFIPIVLMLAIQLVSCGQNELNSGITESKGIVSKGTGTLLSTTTTNNLTQSEINGLFLMREEEKMAQNVYEKFYEAFGITNFDVISNSETRHAEAILNLINHFGLTDPALKDAGMFSNQVIQTLYNQLIASGTSANAALNTGAYIEEYDIRDLKRLIAETTNTEIMQVYTNLLDGSKNHLRAFANVLANQGIVYSPQILSSEDFDAIITGTNTAPNGKWK
ncbi:MAG: DUF2202 domain-containing protein [Paludibacter sp.]|nr:DUF2202 domain-containing protein [Paludibacter sp.]